MSRDGVQPEYSGDLRQRISVTDFTDLHRFKKFDTGGTAAKTVVLAGVAQYCKENYIPLTVSGDDKQVRDILHVEDIIQLYIAAAARIDRAGWRAFNIGGGMEN